MQRLVRCVDSSGFIDMTPNKIYVVTGFISPTDGWAYYIGMFDKGGPYTRKTSRFEILTIKDYIKLCSK